MNRAKKITTVLVVALFLAAWLQSTHSLAMFLVGLDRECLGAMITDTLALTWAKCLYPKYIQMRSGFCYSIVQFFQSKDALLKIVKANQSVVREASGHPRKTSLFLGTTYVNTQDCCITTGPYFNAHFKETKIDVCNAWLSSNQASLGCSISSAYKQKPLPGAPIFCDVGGHKLTQFAVCIEREKFGDGSYHDKWIVP